MSAERAYRMKTRVSAGGKIEVVSSEIPEGTAVEVILLPLEPPTPSSFLQLIDSFPTGPRSADTWEAIEANFEADRNAWER